MHQKYEANAFTGEINISGITGSTDKWKKSPSCNSNPSCVEIALEVLVADSKDTSAERTILKVDSRTWNEFTEKATMNSATIVGPLSSLPQTDGSVEMSHNGLTLTYTHEEWKEFITGIQQNHLKVPERSQHTLA